MGNWSKYWLDTSYQPGFKLKPSKCELGVTTTLFLGYTIDQTGIHIAHKKFKARQLRFRRFEVSENWHEVVGEAGALGFVEVEVSEIQHFDKEGSSIKDDGYVDEEKEDDWYEGDYGTKEDQVDNKLAAKSQTQATSRRTQRIREGSQTIQGCLLSVQAQSLG
ncbi:hypothetical protein BJ508DRAFT_327479 [Ascobolus immersus RN42]|uniref:Uncharacterized protein n=1 Tax=Ascobolus immersus RN42 TaxID=1160509 RepID=A0A3N4I2Z6_ASCIM|nr:hypothetical protein BJ508DRAFT_327479 [Ascobolus immersus RN42]